MNKTVKTAVALSHPSSATASLGKAQLNLEEATKELIAAQAAYLKAGERLTLAEEAHIMAMTTLINDMTTVRDKCKVPNLTIRG